MSGSKWTRWLQFRLSTAIVVTCVAGVLIKANITPHRVAVVYQDDVWTRFHLGGIQGERITRYGSPAVASSNGNVQRQLCRPHSDIPFSDQELREVELFQEVNVIDYRDLCRYAPELKKRVQFTLEPACEWQIRGVLINAATALAILLATAIFCEVLARRAPRRREKRISPLQGSVA